MTPASFANRLSLVAASLFGLCACSSEPPVASPGKAADIAFGNAKFDISPAFDGGLPDGNVPDDGLPDAGVSDLPDVLGVPGEYGQPCVENSDCASQFCISGPAGKVCTKTCVVTCEDGWACTQVVSGVDTVFICKPRFMNLCDPCELTTDCNDAGSIENLCVSHGALGSFCGATCNPTKNDCPSTYQCETTTHPDTGKAVYQCVPKSGQCTCSPTAIAGKLATVCNHKNVFGKCPGNRTCTPDGLSDCDAPVPAEEDCNGLDDNCDGQTDEGIQGAKCTNKNEFGSCPGVATGCAQGKPLCDAKKPAMETCNGLDDDCNGETDDNVCQDGNPCTKDSCSGEDCKHDQGALGMQCDDGNACTQEDQCAAGTCVGGGLKVCDDANACTNDSCDPGKGCVHGSSAAGTACDDDGKPCTADTCNGTGTCAHPALDGSKACPDDGDPCTADFCDGGGTCNHSAANVCSIGGTCVQPGTVNPADPCQVCNPLQSKVQWSAQNGLVCDDGDSCTVSDKCAAGGCKGKAMDCTGKDGVCATGQCQNGGCVATPKPGVCNDGDLCTQNDSCVDGVCKGIEKDCSALGDKCTIGTCQNGQCTQQAKLGSCDDGDPCTVGDSCAGGGCKGTPMNCSGLDGACTKGMCAGGQCVGKAINPGQFCDDGNGCTTNDSCQNGQCTGAAKSCGYLDNQCQQGVCQGGACFAQGKSGGCSDGDSCTVNDACNGGQCSGAAMNCSQYSTGCGTSVCSGGTCTKPAGGACTPGQQQSENQGCGNCGSQTRTRTCTSGCAWGGWSAFGTCSNQGVCAPGQTSSQACGNCGNQSRTCNGSCQWGAFGTCGGQGVCAWNNGSNYKCCGYRSWSFCSSSCNWNPCAKEIVPSTACCAAGVKCN